MQNFYASILGMSRDDLIKQLIQILLTACVAALIAFFQALIAHLSSMQISLADPAEVGVLGAGMRWFQLWHVTNVT